MKTILLPVVFFICLFLAGCELFQQNEYHLLSSSQRSLLKTGDYLVYEDCNSKTDTLAVFAKTSGTFLAPLGGTNCGEPTAYFDLELLCLVNKEDLSDDYCTYLKRSTLYGSCTSSGDYLCDKVILFSLKASEGKGKPHPGMNFYGDGSHHHDAFINSMTVFDKNYTNVYYFESDFIHKGDSIRGIYYSCPYGIIQMDLIDGNVLKLVR